MSLNDKEYLESLYESMSLADIARQLGVSKTTIHRRFKKLGIEIRSLSDAQKASIQRNGHPMAGKSHSAETKHAMSESARKFWDSPDGENAKRMISEQRQKEWDEMPKAHKNAVTRRLITAPRPEPGELSKFGCLLRDFLQQKERIECGIQLTRSHISDIILSDRKIVLELLLPTNIYGTQPEQILTDRYDRLCSELNDNGYRVAIIVDKSNALSLARCERVYEELLNFFEDKTLQRVTIVS